MYRKSECLTREIATIFLPPRGVDCLKFNVRNCGNVVNAFMRMIPKTFHLQIA